MAIRNDPRLYSGGAVVFDSSPTVEAYGQLAARREAEKRAKDEAANQYFNNVLKDLNPAGIRQIHLGGVQGQPPGIIDKINAWQQKAIQNKAEAARGGMAKMELDMEAQDILRDIQKAKSRDKFLLELGKAKFEGKYDPDEDDFHVIDRVSGSIYDPKTYKEDGVSEFGWEDLPSKAAVFDVDRQAKFWDTVGKGIQSGKAYDYSKQYTNPKTGQVIVPFKEVFTTDQIKAQADNALNLTKTDPSAKKHFKSLLNLDTNELYNKYNKEFRKFYGKDISTPEEMAAAEAIIKYSVPTKESQEQEINYQQRQSDKVANIFLNKSGSGISEDLGRYDILANYDGKKQNIKTIKGGGADNFDVVLSKDVDVKDQELIGVKPYKEGSITYYKVRPDGDWEGEKGQVISWAKVAQANLDKTAANEVRRGRLDLTPNKAKTVKPQTENKRPPLSSFIKSK